MSTSLVAVDLATRYSAAGWLSADGAVLGEWDSWQVTESEFIRATCLPWTSAMFDAPDVLLVEDLPHRLPFSGQVKGTCRLQGRIVQAMASAGAAEAVVFVPPAVWRKAFVGLERGTGPEAVTAVAQRCGYLPPDLTGRLRGDKGEKAVARKVATDYCAAFLIAAWAVTAHRTHGTYDIAGTSRYTTGDKP